MSSSFNYVSKISGLVLADYSSQYSGSYAAAFVIDENFSTYWKCVIPTNAYLTILLPEAHVITSIRLYSPSSSYYATSWTLYGSNDGSNFSSITTGACSNASGWQTLAIDNSESYVYYKWVCNVGNTTSLYVGEIELWETLTYTYSKKDGNYIGIKFTQPLVGDVSGLTPTPVGGNEYSKIDLSVSTISTSSAYNGFPGVNTVDENISTYWQGTAAISNIVYKVLKPFALKKLRIYMASYYVKTFTISGSNDGTNYTQIGEVLTGAASSTGQWYEYILDNEAAYSYYRINTLTAYSTKVFLYEVEMYKYGPIGNENYFSIIGEEYNFVPNGVPETKVYKLASVTIHPTEEKAILLEMEDFKRFCNVRSNLTVIYAGGNLMGEGGPIAGFTVVLAPQDLVAKPHQNDQEHIDLSIAATTNLMKIYYASCQNGGDYVDISSITATSVLTNINDL